METIIIERGTKKHKCNACGCKFVLDGNYKVSEKTEHIYRRIVNDYYLHHVYTNCPHCGSVVEVHKYKGT